MRNLVIVAGVTALLLGSVHVLTREKISENLGAYERQQLASVLPGDYELTPVCDDRYTLSREGNAAGELFIHQTETGYNGPLTFVLALDTDVNVLGLRITNHRETPGLTDGLTHGRTDSFVIVAQSVQRNSVDIG